MRIVWWVFAALIGAALIANLALVSARVSQYAEDALVSRRGKAAVLGEDPARLPQVRVALESGTSPEFITFEGGLYRASSAKIPGNAAIVMTGTLVDDHFTAQLRSQLDADVSFFHEGKL